MSKILRLDVETYSPVDLKKCGAAKYFEHELFEILLCSYKYIVDGVEFPTVLVDRMAGEELPPSVMADLSDPRVIKTAFNAAFEIGAFEAQYGIELDVTQWQCTMVHALYCGLPGDLNGVGRVLRVKAQKDFRGSALIRFFCVPCKPTKKNGMRTRNYPHHDPDRWRLFCGYNITDVDSEHEVATRLAKVPVPDLEWHHWHLDMRMNRRGVRVDVALAQAAVEVDAIVKEKLTRQAIELTGLKNPNSVKQLKEWLSQEIDEDVEDLNKTTIPGYLAQAEGMADGARAAKVLRIRQQLGKTSVTKYQTMLRAVCSDGYIRGLTQFYGANRTGRAAGRLVQLQNLRKNAMATGWKDPTDPRADVKGWVPFDELEAARDLLLARDWETIELLWGDVIDVLSQLVRTALLADDGCLLAPVDFSAIEARWLAWAAGEEWRLQVFRTHGKIYEASAAEMFKVPLESIGKGSPLRAKGKIAELALGYQGGEGALIRMGALDMGLKLEELNPLKDAWRLANLKIAGVSYKDQEPGLWERFNDAALQAMRQGKSDEVAYGMRFRKEHGVLFLRLPSGRELCYCKPRLADGDFGPEVRFWGVDQVKKIWVEQKLYGGRITENADQASCRDLLYAKLRRLEDAGLHHTVRAHIHDEVVPSIAIVDAESTLQRVQDMFAEEVSWAPGLPLRGDGFLTPYFRKD